MSTYYIPETTTILLLGLGLMAIAAMQRFRKRLKRVKMGENRMVTDRRLIKDRRAGGSSHYKGPERRVLKYRRSDTERRKKK